MKKAIAVLLGLALVLSMFTGCVQEPKTSEDTTQPSATEVTGTPAEAAAPAEPTVLRYGTNLVYLENLDVHYTTQAEPYQAAMQTHEPLIGKNPDGSLFPLLLTQMPTASEDGLTYTFQLQQGIKFHDGSDLTSADVVATFEKINAPEPVSVQAPNFTNMEGAVEYAAGTADSISGINVIDDYNFTIKLLTPNVAFLNTLSTYGTVMYPAEAATTEGWGTKTFIGTGPFLVSEFVPGVKLVLNKFDGYHGGAKAIDTIEFVNMDENTALLEFEAGTIDITKISDSNLITSYSADPQFANNIRKEVVKGTIAMSFNLNMEPYNNILVRQALSMAINRDEIANKLMNGTAVPAKSFLPVGVIGYDENSPMPAYDPEAVKAKLAEAGYPDGITLDATIADASASVYILQYLEQSLKECNITLNLQVIDAASFGDLRANGQIPMFILTWVSDSGDPSDMLNLYSTDLSVYISSFYQNADFDAGLAQGLLIQDPVARAAHYQALDQKLTQTDIACVPIVHPSSFYLVSARVENFDMSNVFRLFDAEIK